MKNKNSNPENSATAPHLLDDLREENDEDSCEAE